MTPYSPHDQLPTPEPCTERPEDGYFYENTVKHLIPDVVRLMSNGIPIDLSKVEELESTLDTVLAKVEASLEANPVIRQFQLKQHAKLRKSYVEEQTAKLKPTEHFVKPFKHKDMNHRSYFMQQFCKAHPDVTPPTDVLPTGIPKWTARNVKVVASRYPILQSLLDGKLSETNAFVANAMEDLATAKADIYNKRYRDNIANATGLDLPNFNPASPLQKQALFESLDLKSEKVSKDTGLPSWDRDNVERVNRESSDPDIVDFTQSFIDHSFGAIIKNNFIKAFYEYTIDDVLYGSIKLFGAKSFRLTSQSPNLLNMPSTASIYAKPVKQCFIAPPGHVVLAIDYGALEDRVIASLSRDTNKCSIFLDGLDGHSLNAYGYFKDEVAQFMDVTGDTTADVKHMYDLVESGNKDLKAIRQKGKPATFGLSYGAFPPKVAATLKISVPAAQAIFDSYHNELYSGITKYREEYVLPTSSKEGKIHLGLGCYLKTDNARRDIRTLNNATCQFWSLLTLLTINKMHHLIDAAGLQDDVKCISTIYDSIYYIVKADPETIKWTNDNLVPIMVQDFMENQTIPNEATAEIGLDWSDMEQIKNGASLADIQSVLDTLKEA